MRVLTRALRGDVAPATMAVAGATAAVDPAPVRVAGGTPPVVEIARPRPYQWWAEWTREPSASAPVPDLPEAEPSAWL